MESYTNHQGMLGIELIDAMTRGLAWRMFASVKLLHNDPDKIWKTADKNIKNAFSSYPPSPKAVEAKKTQLAKDDSAKKSTEP
jgi:hypothetical protein